MAFYFRKRDEVGRLHVAVNDRPDLLLSPSGSSGAIILQSATSRRIKHLTARILVEETPELVNSYY